MNVEKQKEQEKEEKEKEQRQQWNPDKHDNDDNNAYSLFLYGLRSPVSRDYSLYKEQTSYSDSLDAFRLSLKAYNIK